MGSINAHAGSGATHLLASETHPETGTTSYTYTPDGYTNDLLTSKTDAKGQVTKYTYDSYYRITLINRYTNASNFSSGNDDPCQRVSYVYDAYDGTGFSGNDDTVWGHLAAVSTGDPSCVVVSTSLNAGPQVQQQFTQYYGYAYGSGRVTQKRLQLWEEDGANTSQQYTSWWDVLYTYNQLGQVASVTYPSAYLTSAQTLTTGFDNMQRPNTLTNQSVNQQLVGPVNYNAANQPLQTTYSYPGVSFAETRSYNDLNQLITLNNYNASSGLNVNLSYNYDNSHNNGQIVSMEDYIAQQTVSYTYDALKRLTAASASGQQAWSQSYTYDGFGNMTAKSNSGSTFSNSVNAATNQLQGGNYCYDSNGNVVSDQNGGGCGNPNYVYDIANRMVQVNLPNSGRETYQYGDDNKRLSKITFTSNGNYGLNYAQTVYVYGAMGEKLAVAVNPNGSAGTANTGSGSGGSQTGSSTLYATNNVYWSGRLIMQNSAVTGSLSNSYDFVGVDRLGSVLALGGTGRTFYLPYGEELSGTSNDQIKFATYTRDSSTGLDYADQRFYSSQFGRFMSADRFKQAAKANDSGSWNKYSYTRGDPVNRFDRHGTEDWCTDNCEDPCDEDPTIIGCSEDGGGGGGGGGQPAQQTKCWQDTGKISATLQNLGSDILADVVSQFSSADYGLLAADISADEKTEFTSLSAGAAAGTAPGNPNYRGGHFNLNISLTQLAGLSAADQAAFASDFAGTGKDGVRQAASTGQAAAGGYTLHSQAGKIPGFDSFHFDRFNPDSVGGVIGHGVYDVAGGHLGHPCLDPAWH